MECCQISLTIIVKASVHAYRSDTLSGQSLFPESDRIQDRYICLYIISCGLGLTSVSLKPFLILINAFAPTVYGYYFRQLSVNSTYLYCGSLIPESDNDNMRHTSKSAYFSKTIYSLEQKKGVT